MFDPSFFEPTFFDALDLQSSWWEHVAPSLDILQAKLPLVVYRIRKMRGLLPLKKLALAGTQIAWHQDFTAETAQQFQSVYESWKWDYFKLFFNENRRPVQQFEALERLGLVNRELSYDTEYLVDLSAGWEAYLQSLGRSTRKEIRRKLSQAQSLNPKVQAFEGKEEIDQFFDMFIKLHIAYWKEKTGQAYMDNSGEQAFIRDWAHRLHQRGILRLDALLLNDKIANLQMSIIEQETQYLFLTINTGEFLDYSPGMVGLQLRLQAAAANGIKLVNQGPGDYPYKVQVSNCRQERKLLLVANPKSMAGRAYVAWQCRQLNKQTG